MTAAKRKTPQVEQPTEQIATPGAAVEPEEPSLSSSGSARPVWEGGETRSQFHDRVRAWKLAQAR